MVLILWDEHEHLQSFVPQGVSNLTTLQFYVYLFLFFSPFCSWC